MEDKLVKLQKWAARAILDLDFTVPTETMFTQLKWVTFPERVIYHKAIQMYKTVCGDSFKITKLVLQCSALYTKIQHWIIS